MISLLITLGAIAEAKAQYGPDRGYELPAEGTARPEAASPSARSWLLPKLHFDDSQDCLTFLERQVEGFGTLRVSQHCSEDSAWPVPWRSL